MRFGRKDKDMETKEQRQYEIPMEMTAEVAADFGIAKSELRPIKIGARRTRGLFVPVEKDIYDAYMRPLWRETKREERRETAFSLDHAKDEYEMEIPSATDIAEEAEIAERAVAVRSALASLSQKDRRILTLFSEGHSMAEIAEIVGMSERGARYRKDAALVEMRQKLAAFGEDIS